MKKNSEISNLNCWWDACAQGGFRCEVLYEFVKDSLEFLNLDTGVPLSLAADGGMSEVTI